jgi:hypothetical protein
VGDAAGEEVAVGAIEAVTLGCGVNVADGRGVAVNVAEG